MVGTQKMNISSDEESDELPKGARGKPSDLTATYVGQNLQ